MVDSSKDLTSSSPATTNRADSLRKNLKALSGSSVSSSQNLPDPAASAVSSVTDAVHLSAEAIRSLSKRAGANETRDPQVAEQNLDAATASPEDLSKAKEEADKTGSAIQFRPTEALYAHGDGLSYDNVQRLLVD